MKVLLVLLFPSLLGSTFGSENLRSEIPESHILLDTKQNNDEIIKRLKQGQLRGTLSFEELGLQDERDAQSFCTTLMETFNAFPDWMECTCDFKDLFNVVYNCDAPMCAPDLDFAGIVKMKSLCLLPDFSANLFTPLLDLDTSSCNAPVEIEFNMPVLNDLFPSLFPPVKMQLPQVCATAKHVNFQVDKLESCAFRVGDFNCACSVCESQQDVSVDCSGGESVMGPLAPLVKFECVGAGVLGLDGGYFPSEPFINPLLLLGSDELERRKQLK